MPIVRVDVPEGSSRQARLALKQHLEQAIARTWAREHIYVAIREVVAEEGDGTVVMTVDLRPGRGREAERAAALYEQAVAAAVKALNADPDRFVLLVREFPERAFVVKGGNSLPPLERITPAL